MQEIAAQSFLVIAAISLCLGCFLAGFGFIWGVLDVAQMLVSHKPVQWELVKTMAVASGMLVGLGLVALGVYALLM